ncbi:MAG TPA: HupE/UreJ family protein [Rhodopseudomonas sp.]|uniref:HupE/UreJ family protein n=1 Tax=Rhodopseudomonas sp. TaxID=1078 RepID=UPI002ED8EAE2
MNTNVIKIAALGLAAALLPSVAFAHPGLDHLGGVAHGFAHPLFGFDHVFAMVTVGLLAFKLGGRALWLLPASFVLVMAGGGALGAAGIAVPFVEVGIAASLIALGAIVASGVAMPVALAVGMVGFFAVFHGHAHGAEMPQDVSGLSYAFGFMAATALLHVGGIGLGFAIGKVGDRLGTAAVRTAGGVVAAAGVGLLSGII